MKLFWRSYITAEILSIIIRVKIISTGKFAAVAQNKIKKNFYSIDCHFISNSYNRNLLWLGDFDCIIAH